MKTCCVPGCKDKTSMRHRFPLNDPERFKIWRKNIGNPKFDCMTNEHIYKGMMVCRSHFMPKFHVPGTKMLHRRAIPTENLPEPPEFTSIPDFVPVDVTKLDSPEPKPSKVVKGFPKASPPVQPVQKNYPGMKIVSKETTSKSVATSSVLRTSCAVPGCRPRESRQFRFPNPRNGKERFQKWLEVIKNPALASLTPEMIYENRRVCERHFEPEYFLRPNKLKFSAVPTLFVPDPEAAKDWNYSKSSDCQPAQLFSSDFVVQGYDEDNADDMDSAITSDPLSNPQKQPPAKERATDLRCRICLTQTENAIPLSHSTNIDGEDSRTLCEILNRCCKIEIAIDDNKPQTICIDCVEKARTAYEFSRVCENSESILQKEIENNDDGDSNTILCFIDVSEFEKIDKMCSNGAKKSSSAPARKVPRQQIKTIIEVPPRTTRKSKIYAKCEDSVDVKLRNVRTKQDLILSKECACARSAKNSAVVSVKRTVCVQCCRNFSRYSRFKLYTNVLIGKKRYRCVKCGARFASPRNLNLHLISHKDILSTYDYRSGSDLDYS